MEAEEVLPAEVAAVAVAVDGKKPQAIGNRQQATRKNKFKITGPICASRMTPKNRRALIPVALPQILTSDS